MRTIFSLWLESNTNRFRGTAARAASEQILLEPVGRDTAAAIGFASMHLPPEALMLVLPADHLIPEHELFANDIRRACAYVQEQGGPCTFGIKPDRPETGYGYVKAGDQASSPGIYPVERFVEKPDRTRAEESYDNHRIIGIAVFFYGECPVFRSSFNSICLNCGTG